MTLVAFVRISKTSRQEPRSTLELGSVLVFFVSKAKEDHPRQGRGSTSASYLHA